MAFKVDTPCPGYVAMAERWKLLATLRGGTNAMRGARETYLPKEVDEDQPQYEIRLKRSYLFPGLRDALRRVVSRPFSKPLTVRGELPKKTKILVTDADRNGKSLHRFARTSFADGALFGLTHVLTDAPVFEGTPRLDEEALLKLRPYLVHISAEDLFYWRFDTMSDGVRRLVEIRFSYTSEQASADGGSVVVKRIRRFTLDTIEVWIKNEKNEWVIESTGPNRVGKILLRSALLVEGDSDMESEPPFEDLAWVNLEHWQCSSDQSILMRTARWPLLFFVDLPSEADTGKPEKAKETRVVIGPNRLTRSRSPGSDMKFVEHSGASVKAGRDEIDDLEERMVMLGLSPFLERTGTQTATGRAIDESRDQSDAQSWAGAISAMLTGALQDAAELAGEELPEDAKVEVFTDFAIGPRAAEDIRALIDMRRSREITRETFLSEVKRRGLLADTVDVATEASNVADEEPALPPLPPGNAFPPRPPAA